MAKKKAGIPKQRKSEFLFDVLSKEIKELLANYKSEQRIELTEHLIATFEDMQANIKTQDLSALQQFTNREVDLLKKYRKAFKPYEEKHFAHLFDYNTVLLNKGYYSAEEFKALPKQETALSLQDVAELCNAMDTMLHDLLHSTYLEDDTEAETNNDIPEKEENDTDMTEARRLLAIYYLLKSTLGIEHRSHGDVTAYARFAHLLLGKKISKMADSSIYKKYKKLPNFNKGRQLISDLEYVKPFFQQLNLQKAIELIDKEIEDENNSAHH